MRVNSIMLCDAASVRENLLHVLGAGINSIMRDSFPAPLDADLAVMLEADEDDAKAEHSITFTVHQDGSDEQLFASTGFLRAEPTTGGRSSLRLSNVPIATPLRGLLVPEPGVYVIQIVVDDEAAAEIKFEADILV